jgi:hypothetical protein
MGCRRVRAGYVLFVPVLFMWNVVVLLLMHLLGAADCVVASYVCVIGARGRGRGGPRRVGPTIVQL